MLLVLGAATETPILYGTPRLKLLIVIWVAAVVAENAMLLGSYHGISLTLNEKVRPEGGMVQARAREEGPDGWAMNEESRAQTRRGEVLETNGHERKLTVDNRWNRSHQKDTEVSWVHVCYFPETLGFGSFQKDRSET